MEWPCIDRHQFLVCQATEGVLADKTTQLLLDALRRAAADPGGILLHGNRKRPGLFTATAAARQLAQRCKDEGYLHVVRSEEDGKGRLETCAITEKGLAYLLNQVSPKQVLEDLTRTLEAHQLHAAELTATARQWEAGLVALRARVERVLQEIPRTGSISAAIASSPPSTNGSEKWTADLVAALDQWQASGAPEDCPLPELYRQIQRLAPTLTIGRFHDELRRLHEAQQVILHPWTGPLYEIPSPTYALMIGHVIAYYASRK
jgi:hypothetical protein